MLHIFIHLCVFVTCAASHPAPQDTAQSPFGVLFLVGSNYATVSHASPQANSPDLSSSAEVESAEMNPTKPPLTREDGDGAAGTAGGDVGRPQGGGGDLRPAKKIVPRIKVQQVPYRARVALHVLCVWSFSWIGQLVPAPLPRCPIPTSLI